MVQSIGQTKQDSLQYVQVEINRQGEAMYDATFGAFLQAIRTKTPTLLRSSFADALKTYQTTRWIADASRQTTQSAWNAPVPWVTRAQPSWTNAAADIIKEAQNEQPEQVRHVQSLPCMIYVIMLVPKIVIRIVKMKSCLGLYPMCNRMQLLDSVRHCVSGNSSDTPVDFKNVNAALIVKVMLSIQQ